MFRTLTAGTHEAAMHPQAAGTLAPAVRPATSLRFPHVPALDGIRGLASLAIVFHHCLSANLPDFAWPLRDRIVISFAGYCGFGVDLFFVLSGYLITSLLLLDRRRPAYYRNFYWKRVFRILPALLLVLVLAQSLFHFPWQSVLLTLLFLANFSYTFGFPEIGPFWSLAIEEQFYLLWPAAVRRLRARSLALVLQCTIASAILLRLVEVFYHRGNIHLTLLHSDGLAWGALLALGALRARCPYPSPNVARLWHRYGLPLLLSGFVGYIASQLLLHFHGDDLYMTLTAANLLFTSLLAFILTHTAHALSRFLTLTPLRYLGQISYMLYLAHPYILMLYDRRFPSLSVHPTETALYVRFATVLLLSVVFCSLSLILVERPALRLRRHFLRNT